ncbi:MAG: hypothetical protein WAR79_15720 [Melioribacteraceae bacterium]
MSLSQHYKNLFSEFLNKVKSTNVLVDELIDSENDTRYGITLLIRPPIFIKNKIQIFLDDLRKIEPIQYYYRNSDIHITVMSIISCHNGFDLSKINLEDYFSVISKSIENEKSFEIIFRGITATQSAIMVQGFWEENTLNNIRDNLRENFRQTDLEQSLDKRYSIKTAHSTIVRFRNDIKEKDKFIELLEKYRNYNFGKFGVNELEFVANDWYQKIEKVKLLKTFKLGKK